jgi:BirA family biotin operon repressor/biotin-[acetyl-CoA-carboxylase] ligase
MDEMVMLLETHHQKATYLVLADAQTKGRGRLKRLWVSPLGNFYMSLAFPVDKQRGHFAHYAFVMALALKKSLDSFIGRGHLHFKWPNDMLLHGKKVGGILPEVYLHPATTDLFLIMGVGINLTVSPKIRTTYPVTSVRESLDISLSPKAILPPLCAAFEAYKKILETQGFALIAEEWMDHAHEQGETLTITEGNTQYKGVFCGIDGNGSLLLMDPTTHALKTIHTGDIGYPLRSVP